MFAEHRKNVKKEFLNLIDCHPRLGWYFAAFGFLNGILNIIQLFHGG